MIPNEEKIDKDCFLFSGCLITILNFYKTGDTQTFRIAMKKALNCFNVDIVENQFMSFSNLIFDRFAIFGVIEKLFHHGRTIWRLCNPSIIHFGNNQHLLIGDKIFTNKVLTLIDSKILEHEIYPIPKKYVDYSPSLVFPKMIIKEQKLKAKLNSLKYVYSDINLIPLIEILPFLKNIASTMISEDGSFIPENSLLLVFDFDQMDWTPQNSQILINSGYYKVINKFSFPIYLIHTKHNETYKISEKDWGYFLACYLFNKKISLELHIKSNTLKINYKQFGNFPLLLKRALILKSFKWPKYKNQDYFLYKIEETDLSLIQKKMGLFKVKYL